MHPATARAHGDRITPAQAGKRCHLCASTKSSWDHPRVGGEKTACVLIVGLGKGSPPHRRGKGVGTAHFAGYHGITPAWAGKRPLQSSGDIRGWDHPRIGGEKFNCNPGSPQHWGSPPRGRGKVVKAPSKRCSLRITPAWAGKSPASQPWSPPLWMMVIRPRP